MKTAEIEFQVELYDGKYSYRRFVGGGQDCLRYGEPWRELTGDGMILAMGQEIEDLKKKLADARHAALTEAAEIIDSQTKCNEQAGCNRCDQNRHIYKVILALRDKEK